MVAPFPQWGNSETDYNGNMVLTFRPILDFMLHSSVAAFCATVERADNPTYVPTTDYKDDVNKWFTRSNIVCCRQIGGAFGSAGLHRNVTNTGQGSIKKLEQTEFRGAVVLENSCASIR